MATKQDVEFLKQRWLSEMPCDWNPSEVDGFEENFNELRIFELEFEVSWLLEERQKVFEFKKAVVAFLELDIDIVGLYEEIEKVKFKE